MTLLCTTWARASCSVEDAQGKCIVRPAYHNWPNWQVQVIADSSCIHASCHMQLAPAAFQNAQAGQHSSQTALEEALSDRHGSSPPAGEAAAEADTRAVTDSQGRQPAVTRDRSLSAVPVGASKHDKQAAALLPNPKHVVSEHVVSEHVVSEHVVSTCSASLKRSASLPSSLITLAAAAKTSSPDSAMPLVQPNPDSRLANTEGKPGSLSGPQGHSAEGTLGAANPTSSLRGSEGGLQSAYSLPLVPAAVVLAPSLPTASSASAAAAAAAGSVLHRSPNNSAATTLSRSAFRPYNSKSPGMGSKGTTTANDTSAQNRLGYVADSKYPHIGVGSMQAGQGNSCKAPIADDKENLLPAAKCSNRLNANASKGLASMTQMGSMKQSGAVNTSVTSARQAVGGPSSVDCHGPAAQACEGSQSGMHGVTMGASYSHSAHSGAETTESGDNAASKRAKLAHGVD